MAFAERVLACGNSESFRLDLLERRGLRPESARIPAVGQKPGTPIVTVARAVLHSPAHVFGYARQCALADSRDGGIPFYSFAVSHIRWRPACTL